MRYRLAVLALCLLGAFASESAWANRYYSPETGRFISRDLLGHKADENFYAYIRARPSRFTDPLGLEPPIGYECQFPGFSCGDREPDALLIPAAAVCQPGWTRIELYEGRVPFVRRVDVDEMGALLNPREVRDITDRILQFINGGFVAPSVYCARCTGECERFEVPKDVEVHDPKDPKRKWFGGYERLDCVVDREYYGLTTELKMRMVCRCGINEEHGKEIIPFKYVPINPEPPDDWEPETDPPQPPVDEKFNPVRR